MRLGLPHRRVDGAPLFGEHFVQLPRLWAYELAGPLAIVPWLLPTAIGVPAQIIWIRYYRRKFDRTAPATA